MLFRTLLLVLVSTFFLSCTKTASESEIPASAEIVDGIPEFMLQGNIYEVNVRQYSEEGTFAAFAEHLPRLKEMGVQTLWFMPITPISEVDRKGALGSYYAVQDYTAVNPEFGTMEDWKALVSKAQKMGFKVIVDWVANHTGADNKWLKNHPDFFVLDSITRQPKYAFDWSDTRDLNYDNPVLADSMINAMKFWLTETNIDGFRCDVAGEVPDSFWEKCIPELKKVKPDLILLAEGEKPSLIKSGFQIAYPWNMFHVTKDIAAGKKDASYIDTALNKIKGEFPENAYQMWFTSNHDENSWNKADYGTMPGEVHAPFAVLTQTLPHGIPLIYSGQEEPHLDSVSFFYKDKIRFKDYKRAEFYKTLLELRKDNPALAANVPATTLKIGDSRQLYSFVRKKQNRAVLVIVNLSKEPALVNLDNSGIEGKWRDVFEKKTVNITKASFTLEKYTYKVYSL